MIKFGTDRRHPHHLHVAGRRIWLPEGKAGRIALGSGLIVGGAFGFLPVLGFWMIPLGLVVLSRDVRFARGLYRLCRYQAVKFQRRRARRNGSA